MEKHLNATLFVHEPGSTDLGPIGGDVLSPPVPPPPPEPPPEVEQEPVEQKPIEQGPVGETATGTPGTPGTAPGTPVAIGPDGKPLDPNAAPMDPTAPTGPAPGVPSSPGQGNPAIPPTGVNFGPDGLPIDPSLDANGNPLPAGQPNNGQGPIGPAPGTPGGPPLGPPPGIAQEKFDSFVGTNSVDELLNLLAGENLEDIGANISEEQANAIFAKYGNDPKFLAFLGAGPGGAGQPPTGVNVGPDGLPIDPSLDANGNPLPPEQQGGQPPGPPRKPPGLPQEKFESLRVFNSVDDLIAKLESENLEEIGNNISDEQGSEIIAALTPEELVRLSKVIEEKTGIPLDPDPPDVVSLDPSAESVQVVGSVADVAGS